MVGPAPAAACDPVWLARPDGISVFVALALADTVLDAALAGAKERLHSAFESRLDPSLGVTRGGQRVRVSGWAGPGDAVEGVLVPWAYGPDCRPIAWSGQRAWLPAGSRAQ
jgi:hypothetical protein